MSSGLDDFSLFELFRMEAEEQVRVLQTELLQVESGAATAVALEALMRAAHSLKGAARIVGLDTIVQLTHAMEDRFVAAQAGATLDSADVDRMLTATDWLARLQAVPDAETEAWLAEQGPAIVAFAQTFHEASAHVETAPPAETTDAAPVETPAAAPISKPAHAPKVQAHEPEEDIFGSHSAQEHGSRERNVRIAAERFDQILSLTSEALVASRTLALQGDVLERNRRAIARALHVLEDGESTGAAKTAALREIDRQTAGFAAHIAELDLVSRANERSVERLYRTVLAGRLRPFSDGIAGVQRLVRDTARDLGKQVRLEVLGERTRVDRDILERLEAPIQHLLSNAIDHGIETPAERVAVGKPPEAHLRLHARHENGRLVITVRDDGHGIHRDLLLERIVARNLVSRETATGLSDKELLEFLFLPGFSTRESVSAVSGRGVGLNVVQTMVQEAGGSVTVTSDPGAGSVFRLTLPVTRSVIKVIRLQVEGEHYAVPLVRIDRVAHLEPTPGERGGPPTVEADGERLPVVTLGSLLGLSDRPLAGGSIPLLISGGVAFAVDKLVDETELPVRRLDPRFGKIPGVSAASMDENGLPLLILDMEDLIQTAHGRAGASPSTLAYGLLGVPHILVVDDSHTVREMERRLLVRAGYEVTTAQNGQEAWNLLRLNDYDLLISDVDMPQMNGIELVMKVRDNARMARMPVIILSYKDRDEDRRRGLDAGADFYLTKGAFQNDSFRQAVEDLIGPADAPIIDVGGAA
ncbi:two-component system, chemotaxis family, sensor histidine kinase and response regulator WspE [Granulicella rosea]|uniref:histidine kinase n=1 Tax=Granulicella rosea TaxID=474952 RepID=A0A239K9K7_9BACT|nr:response regulator [Granulicella rosea]SNT14785.1 two-component system, chemotaxis family, sensor histidine kinase and response regulator WspE [Granulicella rosea]